MELLAPIHPGEVLKEDFMVPFGLSANKLAAAISVPTNRITKIVSGMCRARSSSMMASQSRPTPRKLLLGAITAAA